jgi:hypothetical protein
MPTKWLQERVDGSKNGHGIGFEGPGVDSEMSRPGGTWAPENACPDGSVSQHTDFGRESTY